MCSPVKCDKCGKISFIGCGQHLKSIFQNKKPSELCHCNPKIVEFLKKN